MATLERDILRASRDDSPAVKMDLLAGMEYRRARTDGPTVVIAIERMVKEREVQSDGRILLLTYIEEELVRVTEEDLQPTQAGGP